MTKWKMMILVAFACSVGACSTIEGAGRDIADTARWTRQQM
jgi:predicted small secreted protein